MENLRISVHKKVPKNTEVLHLAALATRLMNGNIILEIDPNLMVKLHIPSYEIKKKQIDFIFYVIFSRQTVQNSHGMFISLFQFFFFS